MHRRALVKPQRRNMCTFSLKPRSTTHMQRSPLTTTVCPSQSEWMHHTSTSYSLGRLRREQGSNIADVRRRASAAAIALYTTPLFRCLCLRGSVRASIDHRASSAIVLRLNIAFDQ